MDNTSVSILINVRPMFVFSLCYMAIGIVAFVANLITTAMIVVHSVYRLSAYTFMANVALADSIMTLAIGIVCGGALMLISEPPPILDYVLGFAVTAAWTAGSLSYAFLGINRCIAICFYRTRAKAFNRVSVAMCAVVATWMLAIVNAIIGITPTPLIGIRRDMWTITFFGIDTDREKSFLILTASINAISIVIQWICSILVLMKIYYVEKKISHNKLNQNSANRFRKQARLTFQFFYPSLICTLSSIIYFTKPFARADRRFTNWQCALLHIIWLTNHMCNPFIYAYFNDRMRQTYRQWLRCGSKSSSTNNAKITQRPSARRRLINSASNRTGGDQRQFRRDNNNFVRTSLQIQSRDFEQLCEFMMRVNPLYDSSEGWRESSDDDDDESDCGGAHREQREEIVDDGTQSNNTVHLNDLASTIDVTPSTTVRSSPFIVLNIGRRWINFTKR